MSLINDALKQANRRQQPTSNDGGSPRHLQPVHHTRGSSSRSPLLFAALFFMIASGCWFLYQATTVQDSASEQPLLVADPTPGIHDPMPVEPSIPAPAQDPVAAPVKVAQTQNAVAVQTLTEASDPKPETVPVIEEVFPVLKLTGIIYHRTSPSVIVNGKSLFIGETTQGARLTKVSPTSATFEFDGKVKILAMP